MEKRKIVIGDYDTAAYGWTLAALRLSPAVHKSQYVEKPLGDGTWDISTALTDGVPRYGDRTLEATLELSEGTRDEREAVIRFMINRLDGLRWDIHLPDDDRYHLSGRVSVVRAYNDLAHAAVSLSAVCEPWKTANAPTVITLAASASEQAARLCNGGRRVLFPALEVWGSDASIRLGFCGDSAVLTAGSHRWPFLPLTPGSHALTYSGTGALVITYREAVLE